MMETFEVEGHQFTVEDKPFPLPRRGKWNWLYEAVLQTSPESWMSTPFSNELEARRAQTALNASRKSSAIQKLLYEEGTKLQTAIRASEDGMYVLHVCRIKVA